MKRRIFLVCLIYCFFRLPIYESIAAIFWQSAIYIFVLSSFNPNRGFGNQRRLCSGNLPVSYSFVGINNNNFGSCVIAAEHH